MTLDNSLLQQNPSIFPAGVAQWIEHGSANQRVAGGTPSQGTCLGVGQVPSKGHVSSNHTMMFLSLSFSFPFPLSKNK